MRERELPNLQTEYNRAIHLEILKTASSAKEAEAAPVTKEITKPSKATRALQEMVEPGQFISRAAEADE